MRMAGRLMRLGGKFLGPAFVNAPGAGVGTDQIVFQARLKIGLLADFFEKGQPHGGIVDRHFARPQDGAAGAGGVGGAQAGREKTQRAARALEIGNGRPAFAHQVNQRRMERIRGADAVAQFNPFLLGLLLFRRGLRVGAAHLRDDLLIGVRGGRASPLRRASCPAGGAG